MKRSLKVVLGKIARNQNHQKVCLLNERHFNTSVTRQEEGGEYDVYETKYTNFCTREEYMEAINSLPRKGVDRVLEVEKWSKFI